MNACVERARNNVDGAVVGGDVEYDVGVIARKLSSFGASTLIAASRGTCSRTRPAGLSRSPEICSRTSRISARAGCRRARSCSPAWVGATLRPSAKGSSDWFTGTVRIDPLFQAPEPTMVQGASVTFEAGARTAWHTHPLGQTLIVTAGCGWAQREGGPIEEIRPGDVVWFSAGEKHWHGATPTNAMTHIAIQEKLDGKVVDWIEPVSDEQYRK